MIGGYILIASNIFSIGELIDSKLGAGDTTFFVLLYLPVAFYYPLTEHLFEGKTLGKQLLKIKVCHISGSPATLVDLVLRWLLRAFDTKIGILLFFLSPLLYDDTSQSALMSMVGVFLVIPMPLVGLLSVILTKNSQRLGDIAANTVVVQKAKSVSLSQTILQHKSDTHEVKYPSAIKLRDKDIYIIKNVVERAEKNMDYRKVVELAEKAQKVLGIKSEQLPLHFLQTIIKDYNHLAQEKDLETKKGRR